MLTHLEALTQALNSAFNLPPGVTASTIDRRVTRTLDASTEELWQACTDEQQNDIRDRFLIDHAGDFAMELSDGTLAAGAWYRKFDAFRDKELERLVKDGELSAE
jgi:hypothetical protein